MNWIKEHEIDSWLLRGAVALMLLFPAFYSPYTDVYQSAYYAGFSWAYFLLVLYMAVRVWKNRDRIWPVSAVGILYFAGLLVYNLLSLYFNHKYLHWYWEQINNTVAFLLLAVIVGVGESSEKERDGNIRFLMYCVILSNVGSIIYYMMGYTKLLICNNQFVFFELPENFYETRHYWLYSHKSEYAVMLVAFIALLVAYRNKFKSQLTFVVGTVVLLYCLYLTHSWTGIAGVFLIFAGYVADQIEWKHFHFRAWYLAVLAVFGFAGWKVARDVLAERNIWNLGGRIPIWKGVWTSTILKYPEGWGLRFGESAISIEELGGYLVNNAHNVFFNQMLRFSIPVGIVFTLLFIGIVVYTLVKGRSFLMAGTWIALLVLMDMDYAMMSTSMALVFLIVWLVSRYKTLNNA